MGKHPLSYSVSVGFFSSLLTSCGDDDVTIYDLRPLSQKVEEFTSTTENAVPMSYKQPRRHGFISSKENNMSEVRAVLKQVSTPQTTTYTYEYADNAHLYWTKATVKNDLGDTTLIGNQILDNDGFPTRRMWYDAEGNFLGAFDYIYDKSLYLRTSDIQYLDDPTDNPNAKNFSEYSNEWNERGILVTRVHSGYDIDGTKIFEYNFRSVTQKDVLRGSGGFAFDEYYKEYHDGQVTYQTKSKFDSDGYPQTFKVDNNGDGTYVQIYHYENTKTVEGYLESVVWIEEETNKKESKTTFTYDEEGLLKNWKRYDVSGDDFFRRNLYSYVV